MDAPTPVLESKWIGDRLTPNDPAAASHHMAPGPGIEEIPEYREALSLESRCLLEPQPLCRIASMMTARLLDECRRLG